MTADSARDLHGWALQAARAGWALIVSSSFILAAWGFLVAVDHPGSILNLNQRVGTGALGLTEVQGVLLLRLLPTLTICVLSVFVFLARSKDWFVIFASVFYVTAGIGITGPLTTLYRLEPQLAVPIRIVWSLGLLTAMLALCLFPNGRFVPRWASIVAGCGAIYSMIPSVADFYLRHPQSVGTAASSWQHGGVLMLLGVGLVAQVQRYRSDSTSTDRRHIRLVVASLGILFLIAVQEVVVVRVFPGQSDAWLGWSAILALPPLLLFQLGLTSAIVRHRLFDIERIISRTVSYAIISVILGGIFALFIIVPSLIFGTREAPDYVIAGATLVVAALFRPVRRRVKNTVDQRFNRKRYDAEHTVDAFTMRLRKQIDIDAVEAELIGVVGSTLQPTQAFLWLRHVHP